jgi:hypothetical protein
MPFPVPGRPSPTLRRSCTCGPPPTHTINTAPGHQPPVVVWGGGYTKAHPKKSTRGPTSESLPLYLQPSTLTDLWTAAPPPLRPQAISRLFYTQAHYKKAAGALENELFLLTLSTPRDEVIAAREAKLAGQMAGVCVLGNAGCCSDICGTMGKGALVDIHTLWRAPLAVPVVGFARPAASASALQPKSP